MHAKQCKQKNKVESRKQGNEEKLRRPKRPGMKGIRRNRTHSHYIQNTRRRRKWSRRSIRVTTRTHTKRDRIGGTRQNEEEQHAKGEQKETRLFCFSLRHYILYQLLCLECWNCLPLHLLFPIATVPVQPFFLKFFLGRWWSSFPSWIFVCKSSFVYLRTHCSYILYIL